MKVKVFYTEEQTAKSNQSFSPSAGKPALAVSQWVEKFGDKIEVVKPEKLTVMDLALAHEKVFVEEVLRLIKPNGFGNTSKDVASTLPWTSGSFYSAAKSALENGVAVSPTSGFHHACYDHGGAFCTFNGLMVTAMKLREEGLVDRGVAILDMDEHYGNGTDDIIRRLGINWVNHFTSGGQHNICSSGKAERFLENFPKILDELCKECDILLYQAGADCNVSDPLGGWLNDEQMRRRDRIVFEYCSRNNIPVVWNLAGGYQEKFQNVLDLHNTTMEECLRVYGEK